MLTEDQINEAGLLAIEAEYGTAKKDMIPFSAEIESASGYGRGFCKGAEYVQEELSPKWASVTEKLPSDSNLVLAIYSEKRIPCVVSYTNGKQLMAEIEEGDGEEYLPAGFYEETEQKSGCWDYYYLVREVTHWMPLPIPPESNGK